MPNCFSLTRKGLDDKPDGEPVEFVKIDEELCAYFHVDCDPKFFYCDWYESIGCLLAYGKTFTEIVAIFAHHIHEHPPGTLMEEEYAHLHRQLAIACWLDRNFVADAWAEIGRRTR